MWGCFVCDLLAYGLIDCAAVAWGSSWREDHGFLLLVWPRDLWQSLDDSSVRLGLFPQDFSCLPCVGFLNILISHTPWSDNHNNNLFAEEFKLKCFSCTKLPSSSVLPFPLGPRFRLRIPFPQTPLICIVLLMQQAWFHPHRTRDKITDF
jgi:hypothetical protein